MYLQLDQVAETSKYGVLERNFQSWVFKALNSFQEGVTMEMVIAAMEMLLLEDLLPRKFCWQHVNVELN
ncbi:unnamed protein product [Urochloa humidicola]